MKFREILKQWPALDALLDEVLDLPLAERAQWLERQSTMQPEQRAALDQLLRLGEVAPRLIADVAQVDLPIDTASAPDTACGADPAPGQLIGPYRLIAPLGQGGMGSVWLAERADAQPRRKVALKLPHLGWAVDLAPRLKRERDILASLEHPNIARLYDAGTDALGRPYLALEYVNGEPIDEYCRAHSLDITARLQLVLAVAAAVAYAHTQLVVHRDLKPANILVTRNGEVRLLDFGIAKLLLSDEDRDDLTRLGGHAITVDYASPEQIRGEPIGTPSDVYSLGVVTYELLTGTRPYRLGKTAAATLEQAITAVDVPSASRAAPEERRRQLRGDLDAILAKALCKEPAQRYGTVAAFADDIQRFLSSLPISVRRSDGLLYRFRKYVARNMLQFVAVTLVLLAIIAGAGAAMWQAHLARIEADRADQVKDFALSIFDEADIDSGNGGAATTAADLLLGASKRVDKELKTRPDVAVELMTSIAYALEGQGKTDEAIGLLEKTIATAERALPQDHQRTLAAKIVYGEALQVSGKSRRAEPVLKSVVAAARRQNLRVELVDALRWLSSAQLDLGEPDQALANSRLAIASLPAQVDTRILKELRGNAYEGLANTLNFLQLPGVVDASRHAMEMRQELDGNAKSEALLVAQASYGRALSKEGQGAAGLQVLNTALADAQKFLGPNHPRIEYLAEWLGDARAEAGDLDGAIDAYGMALRVVSADKSDDVDRPAHANYRVGFGLALAHRDQDALSYLALACAQFGRLVGATSPVTLRSRSWLALVLARLGRLDESQREFEAIDQSHLSTDEAAMIVGREAVLRSLQARHEEAIALGRKAVAGLQQTINKTALADASRELGAALLAAGRPAEALAPLREAVRLYSARQLTPTPDQRQAVELLATADAAKNGGNEK